ncbi:LOB domain-containing protein 1-like [Nicotiana tabacum]|uniref:LOB domain-containing protein 1-like n=1 Tax=Nicotiana tabacum TaxID=4097 RepID=A0A1S4C9Q3_TOBAC|nr:LOB domain-containing protein 1-like [Nicotiana tomentosiformis]XP_016497689.1 PREDICTED: LOB domain-containing protein 1-like [Nicotiana tabacum]
MECSDNKTTTISSLIASSKNSPNIVSATTTSSGLLSPKSILSAPPFSPPPPVILTPCAACKILRRRCVDKCVLAPYFPPTDPLKFTIAHRVFGASNIIKMLQELPEEQRADAVNSMVYEANARIRDPVYGCAGVICQLQKQISELQAEFAKSQAEILNLKCQNSNLLALVCMEVSEFQEISSNEYGNTSLFLEDNSVYAAWETLWT